MASVCKLVRCAVKLKTGGFSNLGLSLHPDSPSVWSAVFSTAFRALSNNARKDLNVQANGERNRERDLAGCPAATTLNLKSLRL